MYKEIKRLWSTTLANNSKNYGITEPNLNRNYTDLYKKTAEVISSLIPFKASNSE